MRPLFYIKIRLIALLTLGLGSSVQAQNLVINPSFENVNLGNLRCSWYTSQTQFNDAINDWTCPTGSSTDVFNTALATSCYCHPFSTHASNPGQQAPRTGNGYCNIVTYGSGGCTPWREYIQGRLSSAMVVGQQYEVSFWVSLADKMSVGTNNIGVKFDTNPYSQTSNCPYYTTPDLNYTGPIILDKTNWVQISFTYTPTTAGIDNFIIGNFFNDAATATAAASGVTSGNTIRYFVEDVVIQPLVILNVALEDFQAECVNGTTALNWLTSSELDLEHFTIERSSNGVDFYELAQIEGNGGNNIETEYQWTDEYPLEGMSYYRLGQTSTDGVITYSEVLAVTCENSFSQGIQVYPNPFRDRFTISLGSDLEGPIRITVLNQLGGVLLESQIEQRENQLETSIDVDLAPGIYFIRVDVGNIRYLKKLVKI
jgi:hypothetical protein